MRSHLCISVHFLQPAFHGRADGGEPEWPPSPLRIVQALVAAEALRFGGGPLPDESREALCWLEQQGPPLMLASAGRTAAAAYRLYLPDNVADRVARSWVLGNDADIASYRTEKDVRTVNLPDDNSLRYIWQIKNGPGPDLRVLSRAARSVTHLGWGIDMVIANAVTLDDAEFERLPGERWEPLARPSGAGYRVPIRGTLENLISKHHSFVNRLKSADLFNPVPSLSAFRTVAYRRDFEPATRPFAAFQLLKPDASGMRAFSALRPAVVAGMARNAAKRAGDMAGRDREWIKSYVLGHGAGPSGQAIDAPRFSYLPLPTINPFKLDGSIRRLLFVEPLDGDGRERSWARRTLAGADLIDESSGESAAMLAPIPDSDRVLRRYTGKSALWSTVTPVVLPGFDDRNDAKTESLLRKAIEQAGFAPVLARRAVLDWRKVSFFPGADFVGRYTTPKHLANYSRCHVLIRWKDSAGQDLTVQGPFAIGPGRFCGFGLFATWQ
jgi:CRISPR-associated protein Csb2